MMLKIYRVIPRHQKQQEQEQEHQHQQLKSASMRVVIQNVFTIIITLFAGMSCIFFTVYSRQFLNAVDAYIINIPTNGFITRKQIRLLPPSTCSSLRFITGHDMRRRHNRIIATLKYNSLQSTIDAEELVLNSTMRTTDHTHATTSTTNVTGPTAATSATTEAEAGIEQKQFKRRWIPNIFRKIYRNVVNKLLLYPISVVKQKIHDLRRRGQVKEVSVQQSVMNVSESLQDLTTNNQRISLIPMKYQQIDSIDNKNSIESLLYSKDLKQHVRCLSQLNHIIQKEWNGRWNIITSNDFMKEYDKYLQDLGQPMIVRTIAKNLISATTEETISSTKISPNGDGNDDTGDHNNGPALQIRSVNARGIWDRTLASSGVRLIPNTSINSGWTSSNVTMLRQILSNYTSLNTVSSNILNFSLTNSTTVLTADNERVIAEAYWYIVDVGNVSSMTSATSESRRRQQKVYHHSWLRGITKYGGGDFESIRYIVADDDSNVHNGDNKGDLVYICHSIFHPSNPQRIPACITWRFLRTGTTSSS